MKTRILAVSWLLVVGFLLASCGLIGPKPEIVGVTARDGAPGLDYTVWVDCTVRNNGASGDITVVAELSGGGSWEKRETVSVGKNAERKVTLAFPEATFLNTGLNGYQYNCSTG